MGSLGFFLQPLFLLSSNPIAVEISNAVYSSAEGSQVSKDLKALSRYGEGMNLAVGSISVALGMSMMVLLTIDGAGVVAAWIKTLLGRIGVLPDAVARVVEGVDVLEIDAELDEMLLFPESCCCSSDVKEFHLLGGRMIEMDPGGV